MIVIAKHSEKKLLQEMALCKRIGRSSHCYFLPLSQISEVPKDTVFVSLLSLFHKVKNSYTAQIFICGDRDTFILISDLSRENFHEFLDEFVGSVGRKDFAQKVEMYDLLKEYDTLEAVCKSKLVQAEAARAEGERRDQIVQAEKILEELMQVNPELLQTLHQRRAGREQKTVLIVDDDQLCRSLASNVLSKQYSCAIARTSKDAIVEYVNLAPDALFLDIGLPDISGFDLLEQLFRIDPHAYVIMFSGRKDKQNILKAVEMGAQGFVGKPFTGNQLLEYVRKSHFIREKEDKIRLGKQGVA